MKTRADGWVDTRGPALAASNHRSGGCERLLTDVHGKVKPLLRGRIHTGALVAAVPAGALLVVSARPGLAEVASAVYAATLVVLYGASSAYHRLARSIRSQFWFRRADHASIYLLIAGSYTPICLLVLPGALRWWLLVGVWVAAALGVALKLACFDVVGRLGSILYLVMGWAVVVATPALLTRLPPTVVTLLTVGGVVYTLGAVVLARRWPDPAPMVFGYHELWHLLVVVAGVCHYAAIFQVVRSG